MTRAPEKEQRQSKSPGRPNGTYRTMTLALVLTWGAGVGCQGGVEHPPPNQPNDKAYCAGRPAVENNCMACSSQPGCGWCNTPVAGEAACQPGTSQNLPETCQEGWAFSTEACTPPPPPPPMEEARAESPTSATVGP